MSECNTNNTLRRTKLAARTAVLVGTALLVSILAVVVAQRSGIRSDLTTTGRYSLSLRTQALLDQSGEQIHIALVGDLEQVSIASLEQLTDLTDTLDAHPNAKATVIHAQSFDAPQAIEDLINEAAQAEAETIAAWRASLATATNAWPALVQNATTLAERTTELTREISQTLQAFVDASAPVSNTSLSPAELAEVLQETTNTLALLRDASFAAAQQASDFTLAQDAQQLSDRATVLLDEFASLPPLSSANLERAVRSTGVLCAFTQGKAWYVPLERLATRGSGSLRARAESLVATGLNTLNDDAPPSVVFVHAMPDRVLEGGEPAGLLLTHRELVARLHERGVQIAEWALNLDQTRPAPPTEHAVWVLLEPTGWWARVDQPDSDFIQRTTGAIDALWRDGEHMLLTVHPSSTPGLGLLDPIAQTLRTLGVDADTGRMIIQRQGATSAGARAGYSTTHRALVPEMEQTPQAFADSASGLSFAAAYPLLITPTAEATGSAETSAGVSLHTLLHVQGSDRTWAEAKWVNMLQPQRRRQRAPEFDASQDAGQGDSHLPIALGIEREVEAAQAEGESVKTTQRVVVVAGEQWMSDKFTRARQIVDGQRAATWPGNMAFALASVDWTLGRDGALGAGAQEHDLPRVGELSVQQQQLIAWLVPVGPPVAVLMIGSIFHAIRRRGW